MRGSYTTREIFPLVALKPSSAFAQALTESAKAAGNCLLAISLPAFRHSRLASRAGR